MIVFMDLEMKPVSKEFPAARRIYTQEVIEFGAVMLDDNWNECSSFSRPVKPVYGEIPPRYEELTGVTNAIVAEAQEFPEVLADFAAWCAPASVIYAWSGSDWRQLRGEAKLKGVMEFLAPLEPKWRDYQRIFTDRIGLSRELSLEQAVGICGMNFEGHMHDACWDARNTAAVYRIAENPETFQEKLAPMKININNTEAAPTTSMADLFAKKFAELKNKD